MPVEPVGLILGVVSLIGLFTTCIDLLDAVSGFKTYGAAYLDLVCALEVERVLLLKWGEAAGLLRHTTLTQQPAIQQCYSKHLRDERVLLAVAETLGRLKIGFEDANNLIRKYTPRHRSTDDIIYIYPIRSPPSVFEVVHARQGRMLKRVQSENSFTMKARWAIYGRAKSLELVNNITKLNENLHRLVPIAGSVEIEHPRFEAARLSGHRLDPATGSIEHIDRGLPGMHNRPEKITLAHTTDHHGFRDTMLLEISTKANDLHSCRELALVEASIETDSLGGTTDSSSCQQAQSVLAAARVRSGLLKGNPHHNQHPVKHQRERDWMYSIFFVLFVYVIVFFTIIISLIVAIISVLLSKISSLFRYFIA